ncbi:AarF/ABC1/UbiB kinase family protein [Candidatus Parcubacteria bacterium]|nr:AarF/ABC1/UbiB kinase family protein [Candidatus Parcubacteria bacterium]
MFNLKQKYKNFKRVKEILLVLSKYSLGYFLNLPAVEKYFKIGKKIFVKKIKKDAFGRLTIPQRTRLACEELGPTFVKLGQILSTRPDLIPREFTEEFSKLQDNVPPFAFFQVEKLFEEEFGKSIDELFVEFNDRPVAAASLSQVHKAKLANGEVVAVKIQRPNIKERIKSDISILFDLVKFMEKKLVNGYIYQPMEIVKEFSRTIKQELDFVSEGRNIDKFRINFKENEAVCIPKVYWQLTTPKILTMEYINGVKISDVNKSKNSRFDKKIISARGADMILKQIFKDGFFHGDPHPGNIFVMKNNVVALLDFGMVGRVDEDTMADMANLLIATIEKDADKIIKILEKMDIVCSDINLKELKIEIKNFVDKYYGISLKQLEIGVIIEEILEIMIHHQIKIPSDLVLLSKSLVIIEWVGRDLDPDFDMVSHAKPFAKELLSKKYSIINLWKKGRATTEELFDFLQIFPKEFSLLIKSLRKGEFNINFQHKGLERLILEIDRASNRLSFSMIIGSLIIGSSFVIQANIGPFIFGYPAIGIIGYLFASFLGLFLIISILRSGKWK